MSEITELTEAKLAERDKTIAELRLEHLRLCLLSQVFNRHGSYLHLEDQNAINDWLKEQIEAAARRHNLTKRNTVGRL